ncbi:MAG: hypothetical protein ACK587_13470 [Cyanobacteriota bacterium]
MQRTIANHAIVLIEQARQADQQGTNQAPDAIGHQKRDQIQLPRRIGETCWSEIDQGQEKNAYQAHSHPEGEASGITALFQAPFIAQISFTETVGEEIEFLLKS